MKVYKDQVEEVEKLQSEKFQIESSKKELQNKFDRMQVDMKNMQEQI